MTVSQSDVDPRLAMRNRQPGLDLLRALAIILVVLYHAGLFGFALPFDVQRFGWVGVDLFFVLSGYLIAGQLFSPLARGKSPDVRRFYWRRALRILPAYLAIVAIYFFLPAAREYPNSPPLWKFLTFTQNLGLRGGTAFSHAWSLCIEFQFYLLLPFLILALARRQLSLFVPFVVFIWCIVIRALLAYLNSSLPEPSFGWWQQWIYYPTYARLDPLTIGVSLAAIECFRPKWWSALAKSATWIWLPGLAAIVIALALAEDGLSIASSAFGFSLIAMGMGAFLICALSPRLPLSRVALPGAAFLATVAYSIYLSHKLVIHEIQQVCTAHSVAPVLAYLMVMASILVIGSMLFFAVERPFLKVRQDYVKPQSDSAIVSSARKSTGRVICNNAISIVTK
ncbi:MAG: acyltransferase [Verrucomicrobiota bacterium]|nr:acyltransferase [Verrucomicrobiota bacterium]